MWQREEGGRRGKGDKENGWMGECGAFEVRDELNRQSEQSSENTRKPARVVVSSSIVCATGVYCTGFVALLSNCRGDFYLDSWL